MTIPRKVVPGLDAVPTSALTLISVSPAGDARSWPSLDVDVYGPGLVERAFGTRLFARATTGRRPTTLEAKGRRGTGQRANGRRPRKRLTA